MLEESGKESLSTDENSDVIVFESTGDGVEEVSATIIPNLNTSFLKLGGEFQHPEIRIGGTGRILVDHHIQSGLYSSTKIESTMLKVGEEIKYELQPGWHTVSIGTYEHRIIATVSGPSTSIGRGAYSHIRYKRA